MREWSKEMFTAHRGQANLNTIQMYSPFIQMLSNELTGRFMKRTTRFALGIAVTSLGVSLVALFVAYAATSH